MRLPKLGLLLLTLMLMPSCDALQATEESKATSLCDSTLSARQDHVTALLALGGTNAELQAKRTGAAALSAVAAGCGEL